MHSFVANNESPYDFSVVLQAMVTYICKKEVTFLNNSEIVYLTNDIMKMYSQKASKAAILGHYLIKLRQNSIEFRDENESFELLTQQILFCSYNSLDEQYFCIVTSQDANTSDQKIFCHLFKADANISLHNKHKNIAKSFGIKCSTNQLGSCAEFPSSSAGLINMLHHLVKRYTGSSNKTSINTQQQETTTAEEEDLKANCSIGVITEVTDTNMNDFAFKKPKGLPRSKGKKLRRISGISNSMESLRGSTREGKKFLRNKLRRSGIGGGGGRQHAANKAERSRSCERIDQGLNEDPFMKIAASSVDNLSSCGMMSAGIGSPSQISRRSTLSGRSKFHDVPAGRISHWAVSFDNLLEDPLGITHFREFLTKEFSEENLLFFEACNKLKEVESNDDVELLKQTSQEIFDRFLAPKAQTPININSNSHQLAIEAMSKPPHRDMFDNQQQGVYYLMKLDSYSRFVKSKLYRECLLCEMESRPLPLQEPPFYRPISRAGSVDSTRRPKKKESFKNFFNLKKRPKTPDEEGLFSEMSSSSCDIKELAAVQDLLYSPDSSPVAPKMVEANQTGQTCRVSLWDGSSTVVGAVESENLREALMKLCQLRNVDITCVEAFIVDPDSTIKARKALCLDMRMSQLASRYVVVEKRASFRVELLPHEKSLGINARMNKPLRKAIDMVLNSYNLTLNDVTVKDVNGLLDIDQPVSAVDGCNVIVDVKPPQARKTKSSSLPKENMMRSTNGRSSKRDMGSIQKDTEELFKVVSSMQRTRLDDQCGLISQTNLQLPEFLRIKHGKTTEYNSNSSNNNKPPHPHQEDDEFVRGLKPPMYASTCDLENVPMPNYTPPPPLRHQPRT